MLTLLRKERRLPGNVNMSLGIEGYRPRLQVVNHLDSKTTRNLHPVSAEKMPPVPSLAREVIKINSRGSQEKRIYNLDDTGFHVESQIKLLIENYNAGVSIQDTIQQIEQDINGFNFEYLKEAPVFGIPLEFARVQEQERIVARLYGKKLWVDSVDEIEREGVVKKAVKELEEKAVKASPGTMFVIHSGEGWSGYQAKGKNLEKLNHADIKSGRAKEIQYPDSQTYVVRINEDRSLTAVTLKANMSLSQSEEFVALLQGEARQKNEERLIKERIKEVIGNVVEISPEEGKKIQDIAKTIKHIVGGNVAYVDSLGRERTFDEMQFMLQSPKQLEELDTITKDLSGRFTDYVKWRLNVQDETLQSDLQIALGYTILNLMHEVRGPTREKILEAGRIYRVGEEVERLAFDPRVALEELQKLPGCAGGGNSMKIDSLVPRVGSLGEDEYGGLSFECPDCRRTNVRERGKLLSQCQYTDCRSKKVACEENRSSQESEAEPISLEQKRKDKEGERKAA